MLLGLRQVADHQVSLAKVLVRAAMARVEHEGGPVMLERGAEFAGVAVRVAEKILDIWIAIVLEGRLR